MNSIPRRIRRLRTYRNRCLRFLTNRYPIIEVAKGHKLGLITYNIKYNPYLITLPSTPYANYPLISIFESSFLPPLLPPCLALSSGYP